MTGYIIRPLGRCPWNEVVAVSGPLDGWCWAGHDGMVATVDAPTDFVPTGWLWGWGTDRWVRWRIDARADCVGAELRSGSLGDGYETATVREALADQDARIRSEQHMLHWSPRSQPVNALSLVSVTDPAPLTFMSLRWAQTPSLR